MSKRAALILVGSFFAVWLGLIVTAFVGVKVFGWGEAAIPLCLFVPPFVVCLIAPGGGDGY